MINMPYAQKPGAGLLFAIFRFPHKKAGAELPLHVGKRVPDRVMPAVPMCSKIKDSEPKSQLEKSKLPCWHELHEILNGSPVP